MAKEQRRGNRETKKPKQQKNKVAESSTTTTFKDISGLSLGAKKPPRK